MSQNRKTKGFLWPLLYVVGVSLCVLPPAICVLTYFPLWREIGYQHCIAGGSALLLVICMIPLYRLIRRGIASVSAYLVWLIMFILFFALSRIAEQMTVISFVGFIGNLLGAICLHIAKKCRDGKEK